MKYKPDEGTLIAYLYGELDAAESKLVMEYLNEHPEELKHLQGMVELKSLMKNVQDKEVIAPPIFGDLPMEQVVFWRTGHFKTMMNIAASIVLILVAARLIGPEISYSNGELRISFNDVPKETDSPVQPKQPSLSVEEVQTMINSSLNKNNETIAATWEDNQKKMNQAISSNFASNSKRLDELMNVASQASQDQMRTFVAGLQEENLKLMKDYLQLSSNEQKTYVEALLVDFSKYLQEQRKQDFQVFQTRMSSIEKNTDQFKQETEQILASIISNPDASIRKVNNY